MTHYPSDCNQEDKVLAVDPYGEYHHGKEHERPQLSQCDVEYSAWGETCAHENPNTMYIIITVISCTARKGKSCLA